MPEPAGRSRSRSRSPARDSRGQAPKKQKTSGFKWKEKSTTRDEREDSNNRLERGYRERSSLKNDYRRDDQSSSKREDHDGRLERPRSTRGEAAQVRDDVGKQEQRSDVIAKFGSCDGKEKSKGKSEKKEKAAKQPKPIAPSEPMIVVNVNDRLGTKAEIPCFASDSIKAFKAMVAMKIGRAPHEIMLKRQGERPFKDQLSLEDYGVSNGVQLDLELDTGD